MISVAFVGPDGAGKTTISRLLENAFPLPVKYIYMGINLSSSNVMLPTSRLILALKRAFNGTKGPRSIPSRDRHDGLKHPQSLAKRALLSMRAYLSLANLLAEECFRHSLVWYYQRQGRVVLLDRWFYADYYASSVPDHVSRPLSKRIHGFMLEHVYPKPDLVIHLEAPAEILFARKGEATVERLERRRQEYSRLGDIVENFAVVDASQTIQTVVGDVTALIYNLYQMRVAQNGNDHMLEASKSFEQ